MGLNDFFPSLSSGAEHSPRLQFPISFSCILTQRWVFELGAVKPLDGITGLQNTSFYFFRID